MELTHSFTVPIPVDQAWATLTDLEWIAPCMPGAQLQEIEGDEHRGVVKVKVGPITAQYKGVARLAERDELSGRVVLVAEGRDTRGQGTASATVTAGLTAAGDRTDVTLVTDLHLTGKVAQFGRGALADVSEKLLAEFVQRLEADIAAPSDDGDAAPAAAPATGIEPPTEAGVRRLPTPEVEPVDLLQTAGAPVAKRLAPLAAVLALVLVVVWRRRRRH